LSFGGQRAEKILQLASLYRERARVGYEAVNLEPNTPERAEARFLARRRIIEGLVIKVNVLEDRGVKVEAEIHLDDPAVYGLSNLFVSDTLNA
jgi:hypothetical protein